MKETACQECGIIIEIGSFSPSQQYACPRCKSVFYRPGESLDLVLVMAVTSFLFFIPAIFLPILSLEILDKTQSVTLMEAVLFFFYDGYAIIAIIAAASGVLIPLVLLGLICMMVLAIKMGHTATKVRGLIRLYEHLTHWAMGEVYLISIFVAMVKLNGMAVLVINFGLFSFFFFLISFYISITWFNTQDLWNQHELEN